MVHLSLTLRRASLLTDPIRQLKLWMDEAHASDVREPTAMTLATSSAEGRPSGRTVLLKTLDERGLVFYTNYRSRKATELSQNPFACLTFYWRELERQVIVEGSAERVSIEESERYFHSRPRGSQMGAWASEHQDAVLEDRSELERNLAELEARFAEGEIPLPEYWGGILVRPDRFEFWQGRPYRLHDRFAYTLTGSVWEIERLSP